jgi:hypothetical protein
MPITDFSSTAKLSGEVREAVNAAFDAMTTWRTEVAKINEKNTTKVIEKVTEAARALGWPGQIVDATRQQMQTLNKMQLQTIDGMMTAWDEQIKSPHQSSALLSRLNSLPNFGLAAGANGDVNPFAIYMQLAEQWQKAWMDGLAVMTRAGKGIST